MKRLLSAASVLGIAGIVVAWAVTQPTKVDSDLFISLKGNAESGQNVFWASGCASCHVAPGAESSDTPVLAGGQAFKSDFGTFYAPNISTDPDSGIGGWTVEEFANAVQAGVSPSGQHYYPAFPYTAYAKMSAQDLVDLKAYMDTLPADQTGNVPHDVDFPFNIRRSLGGWKFLFAKDDWVVRETTSLEHERGRYLVEALGHCAECHTPRNSLGGLDVERWLTGAPVPGSKGRVPAITPDELTRSEPDLLYYFETGFTPDFDSAGGHMASVVRNLARLPVEDRQAIVTYLKALP